MKRRLRFEIKMLVVGVAGIALIIAMLIGAILQTSYRLAPVTAQEIASEVSE